jgi:tetratricopeptide (TPR) repeat protein
MSLNGSQLEHTQQVIVSLFNRDELRQAVQFSLDRSLDAIAPDKALDVQVFDLLLWAGRSGRLLDLLHCLQDSRPDNGDLAAIIAETHTDRSPAVHTMPRSPRGTPIPLHKPLRTQHFIGRTAELSRLLADLQPGRTVTLCGPGGIGKTTLAAEAIWTLAPGDEPPIRFPDGIFFHTFYHQPQAGLALAALARAYGLDPRPAPRDAAQQALAGKRALIVLDGAEAADDLESVLAVTGGCGVIITTRRHADAPADYQDLEPLPRGESLALLCAWAGSYAVDPSGDLVAANEMVRLLGGLPLALFLAGRYLAQRRQQASEFVGWLNQTGLDALHFDDRPSKSIPLLMERSLTQVSETARAAFRIAGVLALAPFEAEAVAGSLDMTVASAHQALGELVDYGLVLRPNGSYQVTHALAHAYARGALFAEIAGSEAAMIERLAHYFAGVAQAESKNGPAGFAALDRQRAHIIAVQAAAGKAELWDAVRQITWKMKDYLDLKGYSINRIWVMQAGLEAARAVGDRYDEGAFLNELGLASHALGEHRRAIELYEQALAIVRSIGDREGEGNALGNLGNAYAALGETSRAVELYGQALDLDRAIGDHRGVAADLGNLGNAYRKLGDTRRAIDLYEQQLIVARTIGDRRGEANALGNLGNGYADLGETEQAIPFYERQLAITRAIGDRRGEAIGSWNLGEAYEREGDLQRAAAHMQVCVEYEIEIGHPDAEADAQRVETLRARLASPC